MGLFRRAQSSRDYPAAGTSVTGDAGRFRRSKTSGARAAQAEADKWERRDRKQESKGGWRSTDWTR